MVYLWCTACHSRTCTLESSHRAQRLIQYRADFMVGGRYGKRIRKMFDNKKDAQDFEHVTLADYARGTFIPVTKSTTLFSDFFNEYKREYIERFMRGAEVELYRLCHWQDMFNSRALHSFKSADADSYITSRLEKNSVSKTTINRELTSLKTMFGWAVTKNYLNKNPLEDVTKFKVENIRVRWLNEAEVKKVLSDCTKAGDLDLRDILEVALYTGFRKANLEELSANSILGNKVQALKTKSNKPYEVPINTELVPVLNRLCLSRPSGPLLNFVNFRRRMDEAIKDPTITLHTFRHTFAAQCLLNGVPIDRVCKWLGHYSLEFTRKHYGHLCPNKEQEEINQVSFRKAPGTRGATPHEAQ